MVLVGKGLFILLDVLEGQREGFKWPLLYLVCKALVVDLEVLLPLAKEINRSLRWVFIQELV